MSFIFKNGREVIYFLFWFIFNSLFLELVGVLIGAIIVWPPEMVLVMNQGLLTIITLVVLPAIVITLKPKNLFNLLLPVFFVLIWAFLYSHYSRNWSVTEYLNLALLKDISILEQNLIYLGYFLLIVMEILERYGREKARALSLKIYIRIWAKSSPYIYAAIRGDINKIKNQSYGGVFHVCDSVYKRNALHWAALFNQTAIIKELLRREPQLQFRTDHAGRLPLDLALDAKNESAIKLLAA